MNRDSLLGGFIADCYTGLNSAHVILKVEETFFLASTKIYSAASISLDCPT